MKSFWISTFSMHDDWMDRIFETSPYQIAIIYFTITAHATSSFALNSNTWDSLFILKLSNMQHNETSNRILSAFRFVCSKMHRSVQHVVLMRTNEIASEWIMKTIKALNNNNMPTGYVARAADKFNYWLGVDRLRCSFIISECFRLSEAYRFTIRRTWATKEYNNWRQWNGTVWILS